VLEDQLLVDIFEKNVNVKVKINVTTGLYKGSYPSRIEDVKGRMVALSHPFFKNTLVPLYKDTSLELTIYEAKSPVMIPVKVFRRSMSNGIPILWVVPVGDPVKIQRRRFARVVCNIDVLFFSLSLEEKFPMTALWERAVGIDISLGGMRMRARRRKAILSEGDRLYLRLNLEEDNFLISRTIRVVREGDFLEAGLQFEGYPGVVEKRLIRFIRSKELKDISDNTRD